VTTVQPNVVDSIQAGDGVYAPQEDSRLLCNAMSGSNRFDGARVADLCTGSGVVAIHAAVLGAGSVVAYDINDRAVKCARANAARLGVDVDVRTGSHEDAVAHGPYDIVVSNPPYVPSPLPPVGSGLHRAWDAGSDGRHVLDTLCTRAADLVAPGGCMFLVQSEFAGIEHSIEQLTAAGFSVTVVDRDRVAFGPVMTGRAAWLESAGLLEPGRRTEELVVLCAERPSS
jgi:release factor glutamine methyltransferase